MVNIALVGLAAGVLARWMMPGRDAGGFILTVALGVGGSYIGWFLADLTGLFRYAEPVSLTWLSIAVATFGAFILLLVYRMFFRTTAG